MNKLYIEWSKKLEALLIAQYGPDYCYDRQLFKMAYAAQMTVEDAVAPVAAEIKKQLDAEAAESAKSMPKLNMMVAKAVGVSVWAIENKLA